MEEMTMSRSSYWPMLKRSHPTAKSILGDSAFPKAVRCTKYLCKIYLLFVQVAAIMPGEGHDQLDIVIHLRSGAVQHINQNHRSYDPLHYVLLNPYGIDGWVPHLKDLNGGSISIAEFYSFYLQVIILLQLNKVKKNLFR